MIINEKSHIATVIASLDKIYNQSKINGQLHSTDVYVLDSITKLLHGCENVLNDKQTKILTTLYFNILNSSKYICSTKIYKPYYSNTVNSFVQAETTDCNTIPTLDLIYYWQEELGRTSEEIITNINTGEYLDTKTSDLKTSFIEGKNITYSDVGLICFSLNNVPLSANYKIYDDDNNADITSGFQSFYNSSLRIRTFISLNIYSYGLMNFKIKKI